MMNFDLKVVVDIAEAAGREIMTIYESGADFQVKKQK